MNDRQRALLNRARTRLFGCTTLLEYRLYDDAVLRACDAMFCAAEAFLAAENTRLRSRTSILPAFRRRFVQSRKVRPEVYAQLVEAAKDRREIELEADAAVSPEQAEKHVHNAEEFVEFALIALSGKPAAPGRRRRR